MAMSPPSPSAETAAAGPEASRRAETRALTSQAPPGQVAALAVAILVAWGLARTIPGWQVGLWLAAVASVTAARAVGIRRARQGADGLLTGADVHRHLAWTSLSGTLWAVLPWLPGDVTSEAMFLLTLGIVGLTAGAAVAYAPAPYQFEAFSVPPVLSLALRLLLDRHPTTATAALLCPVYLAAMAWLGWKRRKDAVALASREVVLESLRRAAEAEVGQRRAEAALDRQRQSLELLTDSIPALISYVMPDRTYGYVNSQYERYFGRSRESMQGASIESLAGEETYARLRPYLERALAGEEQWFEFSPRFPDGRNPTFSVHYVPDWSPDGRVRGCFALLNEVTEYKATESRLLQELRTDYLTRLLNRHGFLVAVAEVLTDHRKRSAGDYVCYLDLNHFKRVNDRAGHAAGDVVLREVASLMRGALRRTDVLARIGGDEFGLLLPACTPVEARTLLESLRDRIAGHVFVANDHRFHLGISIGAVAIDRQRHRVEDLVREADAACYRAKRVPGGNPCFAADEEPAAGTEDER